MSIALQHETGKLYEPTQMQFDRARRSGKVPRSHEVSSTIVLAVGLVVTGLLGPVLIHGLREMIVKCLGSGFTGKGMSSAEMLRLACGDIILPMFGMMGGLFLAAIIGGFLQVGPVMTTDTIKPDFERISLSRGLKRMFSGESFMQAFFALLKISLVSLTLIATLRNNWMTQDGCGAAAVGGLCNAIAGSLRQAGICVGLGLGAIAVADWAWQRYRWSKNLMMTRKQWLDDIKQMSGRSGRKKDIARRMWNIAKLSGRRAGKP